MSRTHNTSPNKIKLFMDLFVGIDSAYGTVHPKTGNHWIVKSKVSEQVIHEHLSGTRLFASFLLKVDKTKAIAVDFDTGNKFDPFDFYAAAKRHGISSYIETSKQKGFHVWCFMEKPVPASKARRAVRGILSEIGRDEGVEIFPKQDRLDNSRQYGNTINTPLFGALTPKHKTVFVAPESFKPYVDQWHLLSSVEKASEKMLDEVIENTTDFLHHQVASSCQHAANIVYDNFSLPPCIQVVLQNGVFQYQKSSCFWLAVHLKNIAFPQDITIAILKVWSKKNTPAMGRKVMKEAGITSQVEYAYKKNYKGFGCTSVALRQFCDKRCRINIWRENQRRQSSK